MKQKPGRKAALPSAVGAWRKHRPKAVKALALHIGVTQPAVSKWRQVPADRLKLVAEFLDLPPKTLRPDLYPAEPWSAL